MNLFNQGNEESNQQISMNHGSHELLDVREVLKTIIGSLNQMVYFRDKIQDQELLSILDRQYAFMLDEYNITQQAFSTGRDPDHPTGVYHMQTSNDFEYGLSPSQPLKPIQNASEWNDDMISGVLLGIHKASATGKTAAALECTNPVVRRVLQDSVPNCIEMAYEISLYQNKKGIYQVPKFSPTDMNTLLTTFTKGQGADNMPN